MAFFVKITWGNGYRCSCCRRSRTSDHWVESLEEALSEVPTEMPIWTDFGGLEHVEVIDGSNQDTIASASISYPMGTRSAPYSYTRWSGYKDGEWFDTIIQGTNTTGRIYDDRDERAPEEIRATWPIVTDKTWKEIQDGAMEAYRQEQLRKAERELEEAQQKIKALTR